MCVCIPMYIYTLFYFTCMGVLSVGMSIHHICALLSDARRGHQIPDLRTTNDCDPLCGFWESDSGLL